MAPRIDASGRIPETRQQSRCWQDTSALALGVELCLHPVASVRLLVCGLSERVTVHVLPARLVRFCRCGAPTSQWVHSLKCLDQPSHRHHSDASFL